MLRAFHVNLFSGPSINLPQLKMVNVHYGQITLAGWQNVYYCFHTISAYLQLSNSKGIDPVPYGEMFWLQSVSSSCLFNRLHSVGTDRLVHVVVLK